MPEGLSRATFTHLGEYEQCLDITVPHSKYKDRVQFQGQYCLVEIRFPLPPKSKRYRWYDSLEDLKNFTGTVSKLFYHFPRNDLHSNKIGKLHNFLCHRILGMK
ncbi:hypothetical protein NPIL_586691 [Nephila pilipes]|uniref:Nose resistant-to-fluoxetine protein N-terminal domain-containing protein n=1 Tax=Nephila pilipes TaxID=299642 RepID=A0A8X6PP86_NEPPI|nr:hypothetical protein NPIL_586691 [Nephila pilipes]